MIRPGHLRNRIHRGKPSTVRSQIADDVRVGVGNLLTLAEDILVMWAVDHPAVPGLMEVSVIPEAKRNPAWGIKYKMGMREAILGNLADLSRFADRRRSASGERGDSFPQQREALA